jgi:SAM-dependent methyltransferase
MQHPHRKRSLGINDLTGPQQDYAGHRILEAMRSAPRYADAVYSEIRAVAPLRGAAMLDFGAGDGVFFEKFANDGYAVDSVEPDPNLRLLLRRRCALVFEDVSAVPSDGYDFLYTVNVLEHIAALDDVMIQLRRVLRAGGLMFVFVPAFNVLWTSLDDEVDHVQRFTRKTLGGALNNAGFEILNLRYFDCLGFPAALMVRALEMKKLFRYSSKSVGFYDSFIFPMSRGLDRLTLGFFGKNLIALVRRPSSS